MLTGVGMEKSEYLLLSMKCQTHGDLYKALLSVSVLLQKAPLMLEDLQGMGAALPNLEGSSLPFQKKVSGVESPAKLP